MQDDLYAQFPLEERTVGHTLAAQAAKYGDKPLFIAVSGESVSYRDMDRETNRIANGLVALGVGHQDTVLVMLPDTIDFVRVWWGLSKRGAIEVPVNLAYRGRILTHICNDSKAGTIIVDRKFLDRLEDIADDLEHLERCVIYSEDPAQRENLALPPKLGARCSALPFASLFSQNAAPVEPAPAFHDLMSILYTSGTTGPSKGVMIPHAQSFIEALSAAMEHWLLTPEDVFYNSGSPFFHVQGKAVAYCSLIAGCTAVVRQGYKNDYFWRDVREHGCTVAGLLGAIGNFLWQQPERADDADNPMTKVGMYPVIPEHEAFARRFGVEIATTYSQTECPPPVFHKLGEPFPSPRCIGVARRGVDVKILDEHDRERPVGELGEICVRTENPWELMLGYWQRPEATAKAFRNLWYHTGDAGYIDAEGRVYFVDRLSDSMRRRGENISSMEVEDEINSHPQVLECAAYPVAADEGEQEVMAAITPKPGERIDPAELIHYLNRRMPYFMVPRYLDFAEELPKTPTDKIRKAPLREKGVTESTWDRVAAGIVLEK